jgi:hypothetical protein
MGRKNRIYIDPCDYEQKGLYLLFEDSTILSLTESEIENVSCEFWRDPDKIPPEVKEVADFKLCPICPEKKKEGMCYALRPVLPFLELIDKYASFDKVIAVYKGEDEKLLYISDSSMAAALQYISILSLIYYCRVGRKYWKYYLGVIPLQGVMETINRIYLNIYWLNKGNLDETNKIISELRNEIMIISKNQVKRLNLICRNDAFVNAFASTHIAAQFLYTDIEETLQKSFDAFDNI